MLPHTAPYVFTSLIFFVPAAILAEAGLSFLGLGDPTLPTWGQVLEDGYNTGAVYLGYWWWVVSPGLLIIITAVTFMLLAIAMEPIVEPAAAEGAVMALLAVDGLWSSTPGPAARCAPWTACH